jgi:ketosteroid isomerase-like protein
MSQVRMLICLVVLLTVISGCAKLPVTPIDRAADEQAIGALEIKLSKAVAAKDLDALVSLYADNGALYDEEAPIIRGKDAIREAWKADFTRPDINMSTTPRTVEISERGNLAWAHGLFSILHDSADRRNPDSFDYALVYMRQPDGKWKIMADNAHTDLRRHLFHQPLNHDPALAPLAPLIGLGCVACTLWCMFGMPVVAIALGWKACRKRKMSTGFIVSVAMVISYLLAAGILWVYFAPRYWNLPFWAFGAATDTARYGNPVEDTAEGVLISLMVLAALVSIAVGLITWVARRLWMRYRPAKE